MKLRNKQISISIGSVGRNISDLSCKTLESARLKYNEIEQTATPPPPPPKKKKKKKKSMNEQSQSDFMIQLKKIKVNTQKRVFV